MGRCGKDLAHSLKKRIGSTDAMYSRALSGSELIAQSLKTLQVDTVFGLVGIPVFEVAEAIQKAGIRFIACRNEQTVSYAAQAYGYLAGKPGVCLVVGGPGLVHALAGIVNAQQNNWPMLVMAGSVETGHRGLGGFQEFNQMDAVRPYTKWAGACEGGPARLPWMIEKAYRTACYGRPGVTYVDLPADYIQAQISQEDVDLLAYPVPQVPQCTAPTELVRRVVIELQGAKNPLIVIGKGAAYARAEESIRRLIDKHNLPFLPTPMGKGVVPDSNPRNTSAARSVALRHADVVLLLAARLNWILHFGMPSRWSDRTRFIQIDILPEELGNNSHNVLSVLGDVGLISSAIDQELADWIYDADNSSYVQEINSAAAKNVATLKAKEDLDPVPLSYESAYKVIRNYMSDKDVVYVTEGANTMDIARSSIPSEAPRLRLDAGTFATMGVGLGYCIAAAVVYPEKKIVGIIGDSAFGFSAMDFETVTRNRLNVQIFVINNNGVYHGLCEDDYHAVKYLPPTALSFETRYDLMGLALGGQGDLVRTSAELSKSCGNAYKSTRATIINVLINPAGIKQTKFRWQVSN